MAQYRECGGFLPYLLEETHMNKWIKKSLLVLSLGSMMAMPVAAESLDLSEGTMSAGGLVGLNMKGNLSPSTWKYNLGGIVTLDYFLIDNLSLGLTLGANYKFGDNSSFGFGGGLGVNYFFDMGSNISPYLSVAANVGKVGAIWAASIPVGVGLLVAMNSSVGLVFGVNATFGIPFKGGPTTFDMGVGYAGVKAFF